MITPTGKEIWTIKQVRQLKQLYAAGESMDSIAFALGTYKARVQNKVQRLRSKGEIAPCYGLQTQIVNLMQQGYVAEYVQHTRTKLKRRLINWDTNETQQIDWRDMDALIRRGIVVLHKTNNLRWHATLHPDYQLKQAI